MTERQGQSVPEWIAEIISRWVPPEDYDAQLSGVVAGYVTELRRTAETRHAGLAGQPE